MDLQFWKNVQKEYNQYIGCIVTSSYLCYVSNTFKLYWDVDNTTIKEYAANFLLSDPYLKDRYKIGTHVLFQQTMLNVAYSKKTIRKLFIEYMIKQLQENN